MLGKSGGAGGRKGLEGEREEHGVVGGIETHGVEDSWCGEQQEFVQGGGVKDECDLSPTQGGDPRVFFFALH
jgi:hypothetical protein